MHWEVGVENGKRYCVMCLADGDKTPAVCLIKIGGTNGEPECDAGYCEPCADTMRRNGFTIKPLPERQIVQNVQNRPKKEKPVRRKGGITPEQMDVIRFSPDEKAVSLGARLGISESLVYYYRNKIKNESTVQPVQVDPKRNGSAHSLVTALEKKDAAAPVDKKENGGTFVVTFHLTDAEILKILTNMSADKRKEFFRAGLRAALLGE